MPPFWVLTITLGVVIYFNLYIKKFRFTILTRGAQLSRGKNKDESQVCPDLMVMSSPPCSLQWGAGAAHTIQESFQLVVKTH